MILKVCVCARMFLVREVKVYLGEIFGAMIASEHVPLDVSYIRAVGEEFGVFYKWYISFFHSNYTPPQ